jgi:hypothetical protein
MTAAHSDAAGSLKHGLLSLPAAALDDEAGCHAPHNDPGVPAAAPPAALGPARRWSCPTSTRADLGRPDFDINSTESSKGTTSSAREWRIRVPGFTVLACPQFFQAGQSRTRRAE